MEFNNETRQQIYGYWCYMSSNLISKIKKYILDNLGKGGTIDSWLESCDFDVDKNIDKLELVISILMYNFTFYSLNFKKNLENGNNAKNNTFLNNIDIKLINLLVDSDELKDEFEVYISNMEIFIKKNSINSLAVIYEDIVCEKHRKENGEFYTEDDISKFITAFSLGANGNQKIMNAVDTMCGTGMFLKNVQELNCDEIDLWGIEKNKFTAYICNRILENKRKTCNYNINIINRNLFSIDINNENSIETMNGEKKNIPNQGFDLIIGNPAYIRYQALGYLYDEIPIYIKEHYISLGRPLEDSSDYVKFVGVYIRALLLCESNYKENILQSITKIVKKREVLKEDSEWEAMVKTYSGLSDSTVPTWFLSYKLCKEYGVIGYITSDSWIKKEYGNSLKIFLAKKTKLKYIFDMSNVKCFKDVQVNTSIVICQKSSITEDNMSNYAKFIKFKGEGNRKVELGKVISNVLYRNDINIECEVFLYSKFQKFVDNLTENYEDEYVNIKIVKQMNLVPEEEQKIIEWGKYFETNSVLDKIIKKDWNSIEKNNILINQGLRSGYNNFFYFDSVDLDTLISIKIIDDVTNCDFKYKKWEELSKQEKLKIKFNNIINLPNDYIDNGNKYRLLIFKYENMGIKNISSVFMDVNYLKKSIKSIKNIDNYCVKDQNCKNYVLDVNKKVISQDYKAYKNDQNLNYWISNGFGIVEQSVENYIEFYNKQKIKNKDKYIEVKDMPVLKGYQNKPSKTKMPTMWYTLNFTDRHLPDMFLNRINHKDLNVILNNFNNKYVIDANFNTITLNDKSIDEKMMYFAIFNSTIFKLQLENNCANLGGGALKIETSGIKKCKVPDVNKFSIITKEQLVSLANELATKKLDDKAIIKKIDTLIIKEILKLENIDSIINDLYNEYSQKVKDRITK